MSDVGAASTKPKIVYLVGPTAAGKTEAALALAQFLQGEIVSADSMQIYRYMDIGTAKPTKEQRRRIPHHLIDVVAPDEAFNAALFCKHARAAIHAIRARGNNVIVSGGTGLYLKALAGGLFRGPGRDEGTRQYLRRLIRQRGLNHLVEQLRAVDPQTSSRIDHHNERRVIRALEVYLVTGKPLSVWHREHQFRQKAFRILKIGLHRPRELLYQRINARCVEMLGAGLLDEVAALVGRGYAPDLPSLRSVGYRQMILQLSGVLRPEDALTSMQQETRRLAKRQLTWFRADPDIVWLPADDSGRIAAACRWFLEDHPVQGACD